MLHTPFPTKPIQVDDARFISTQSLSFLDKSESKFPIKMDDRVFPYLQNDYDTYYGGKHFRRMNLILGNDNLSDEEKMKEWNELAKKIWLTDKLTGGRLSATGGRDPNKHRHDLKFETILSKCNDACFRCGIVMNYFMKFNRWYFQALYRNSERPSLDRIISRDEDGNVVPYTNDNTVVCCLRCNWDKKDKVI